MFEIVLIAAGLGGLIHLIILLVIGGIALSNKLVEKHRERKKRAAERRLLAGWQPEGRNKMESNDIDQFLDEMLGKARGQRRPPPQPAEVLEAEVVVLRPSRPSVPPARRVQQQRRVARPVPSRSPQQAASAGGPKALVDSVAPAKSDFSRQIQSAVDQAANAATAAGALQPTLQSQQSSAMAVAFGIMSALRTPADIRRAFLLSEIFGPPRALRGRRRF